MKITWCCVCQVLQEYNWHVWITIWRSHDCILISTATPHKLVDAGKSVYWMVSLWMQFYIVIVKNPSCYVMTLQESHQMVSDCLLHLSWVSIKFLDWSIYCTCIVWYKINQQYDIHWTIATIQNSLMHHKSAKLFFCEIYK